MSLEVRFRQIVAPTSSFRMPDDGRSTPMPTSTVVSMPAQVNRLVPWIWIGGIVLTAGMVLSILPDWVRIASR